MTATSSKTCAATWDIPSQTSDASESASAGGARRPTRIVASTSLPKHGRTRRRPANLIGSDCRDRSLVESARSIFASRPGSIGRMSFDATRDHHPRRRTARGARSDRRDARLSKSIGGDTRPRPRGAGSSSRGHRRPSRVRRRLCLCLRARRARHAQTPRAYFRDHCDLSVATMRVHLDHDSCMEVAVLKGYADEIRHMADHLTSERGVRHGRVVTIPVRFETQKHAHGASATQPLARPCPRGRMNPAAMRKRIWAAIPSPHALTFRSAGARSGRGRARAPG